jgi:hypothetical protein
VSESEQTHPNPRINFWSLGSVGLWGVTVMTASEYQKRALECLELSKSVAPKVRATLLEIARAWLVLADDAQIREEPLEANQNGLHPVSLTPA